MSPVARGRSRSGSAGSPSFPLGDGGGGGAPKNQALLEAQALMINQKRRESFVGEAQLAAQAAAAGVVATATTTQDGAALAGAGATGGAGGAGGGFVRSESAVVPAGMCAVCYCD